MDLDIYAIVRPNKRSQLAYDEYGICCKNHTRALLEYKCISRILVKIFKSGQDYSEAFKLTIECGKRLDAAERRLNRARHRLNKMYMLRQNAIKRTIY